MITVNQIQSCTKATKAHPELAEKYRDAAATIASWQPWEGSPTADDRYQGACRLSAAAFILEDLCAGVPLDTVLSQRLQPGELWQVSRLPEFSDLGATPQGKQPLYECPHCFEDGTIPHGGRCNSCGATYDSLFRVR